MTVTQAPAEPSDPDDGDTVTLAFALEIVKSFTGPPTAVTMNVPLTVLPAAADSVSLFGVTCSVPGAGGGEEEAGGDGEGDGDLDGDAEDRSGAGDRDVPGDAARVGPSAGDAGFPTVADADADADAGLALGDDRPPAGPDDAPEVPKPPPLSATTEAWARCGPPVMAIAAVPASTTAAATAATPATARGCRRASRHHLGPTGTTGTGKPVRPNGPARCATLARLARPTGVLSAQAASTCSRSPAGATMAGPRISRRRLSRGRPRGARRPEPTQAFVPGHRVQPGAQLARVAEPLELGRRDDKGVRYRAGRFGWRMRVGEHGPAVCV